MTWDLKTCLIVGLFVMFVSSLVYSQCKKQSYDSEKRQLLNQIATRDKTIEVTKGVFVRLTTDTENLKSLLDNSDRQVSALTEQLELQNQRLVALDQAVLTWKRAYEGAVIAKQEPPVVPVDVPKECVESCGKIRTRVSFTKDFGYLTVDGHTVTNPPEGHVSVRQGRPLVLTLALTQGEDGSFKTFVTSSEDNIEVDLKVSSVDTSLFKRRWYEKIGALGSVAVGSSGMYSSIGLSYDIGSVSIGPTYGFSSDSALYGFSVTWRPLSR